MGSSHLRLLSLFAVLLFVGCANDRSLAPALAPTSSSDAVSSIDWPNEPAGFTLLTDEAFDALSENGWNGQDRETINGSGLTVVTDPAAPLSPANVLQFKYADSFPGGVEPGVEFFGPPSPVRETYFAFWWKPSNPWQNHAGSGVNKIAMLHPQTGVIGVIYIMMFFNPDSGGFTIQVSPSFEGIDTRRLAPNVTYTPVALGEWHQIEWYVKYSSTPATPNGVTKWWLDGVLQGSYTDLRMPADAGFIQYEFSPTWGGVEDTKSQTDFYWYDHARISRAP